MLNYSLQFHSTFTFIKGILWPLLFCFCLIFPANHAPASEKAQVDGKDYTEIQLEKEVLERTYQDGRKSIIVEGNEFFDKTPKEEADFSPTTMEVDLGYVVFSKSGRVGMLPETKPSKQERIDCLSIFACPGEYEPASFGIYAIRDLGKVRFSVGQLVTDSNQMLPFEAVEVRVVKSVIQRYTLYPEFKAYQMTPWLLEPAREAASQPEQTLQIWLSVYVPQNAQPGLYKTKVLIIPQNAEPTEIPFVVEVLPLKLSQPLDWGMVLYAQGPNWDPLTPSIAQEAMNWSMILRDMKFMRGKLGLTSLMLEAQNGTLRLKFNDKGEWDIDFGYYDKIVDLYKQAGFPNPPIVAMSHLPTFVIRAVGAEKDFPQRVDDRGFSAIYLEADKFPQDMADKLGKVLRNIYNHSLEANWPSFHIYYVDEPVGPGWKSEQAKILFSLSKKVAPEMQTASTLYAFSWFEPVEDWIDLDICHMAHCLNNAAANRAWRKISGKHDCKLYGISWFIGEADFWGVRRLTLLAEKGQMDGIMEWEWAAGDLGKVPYYTDRYFSLRGELKDAVFIYRDPNGADPTTITTMTLEGVREGIDDSRYLRTLRKLIDEGNIEGGKVGDLARRAQLWLDREMETIPWMSDAKAYRDRWTSVDADGMRRKMANWAIRLQNALAE
ncbi:MAG: hypothetical protein LLF92_07145 [Planctomycetaceae bacterium]|nr:hypothetical protein [Planctomycetaceae bacterium]